MIGFHRTTLHEKSNLSYNKSHVAWLTAKEQGMTALRGKDKKDVYFLTTIHSPPVVPDWVEDDNSGGKSEEVRNESDVVCRRVKL